MELNIKESLESVKIYGRYLSEFLLPDQMDLLAKSLQKGIEQKLTLTDVSKLRELLEDYQHFIDWNEEHDRKASTSERIESFIASNCC